MLFRPVSVDELIDELATQAPHLTDEHLTRLGALVASLSGNKVSDSPEGGGRVVSGSIRLSGLDIARRVSGNNVSESPVADASGNATSDEVVKPEPIPESVPESEPEPTSDKPTFERFERPRAASKPTFQTIPDWAEANGFPRPKGRPPRWAVEGWRKDNPDAPELQVERKLREEAARREQPAASYDVRVVPQPPQPVEPAPVSDRPPSKNRCACGAKLSGGARRYGHTKCAPCRIRDQAVAEAVQSTGHMEAGKSAESVPELPSAVVQTRRSEPVTHQSTPNSVPTSVPEKGPESDQSTGHIAKRKLCKGCFTPMAAFGDFDRCVRCRKADEDDLRSEDQGSRVKDPEPSRGEPKPLAQHLGRKCAGPGCEAPLSRYNPEDTCSKCQAKRRAERVEAVRQGRVPDYEPPSRESGAVAPRAQGDVVLSDGQLAAPLTVTEAAPRRAGPDHLLDVQSADDPLRVRL